MFGPLLATAALAASGAWSIPASVPTPAGDVSGAPLDLGPRGPAVLWEHLSARELTPAAGPPAYLTRIDGEGRPGATTPFAHALSAGPVALTDGSVAFVIGRRARGGRVALTDVEGPSRQRHRLATLRHASVSVAPGPGGEVLFWWLRYRRFDEFGNYVDARIEAAIRRADGRLAGPFAVARDASDLADAAFDPRGGMVFVYARQRAGRRHLIRTVETRTMSPAGRLGPAQVLGSHDGETEVEVAAAPDGGAFAVWGTQSVGQEASGPWQVRVAHRAPAATRFDRPQVLDAGGRDYVVDAAGVHLAVGPDSSAAVSWSGQHQLPPPQPDQRGPFTLPVRVATLSASGALRSIEEVAPNGQAGHVGFGRDGALYATWARMPGPYLGDPRAVTDPPTNAAQFASRPPGADRFGPAETLETGAPQYAPALDVLDDGRLLAVWTAGRSGHEHLRVAVRANQSR